MDKLCQCRREKLEKVSTGFISAGELEDELELIKFSPCTCNTKAKEEPKPACDHIVKIESGGWEEPYLNLIDASGNRSKTECEPEYRYYPKYCPECGEAIEKQLND